MYAKRYGTDWEEITVDEALERAYALGVAEVLGEHHDDEYDRLEARMTSGYEESMLELSYQDGKKEAAGITADTDDEGVWAELVEDEPVTTDDVEVPDDDDRPTDSRGVTSRGEMLDKDDRDSTDVVSRPDFLDNG